MSVSVCGVEGTVQYRVGNPSGCVDLRDGPLHEPQKIHGARGRLLRIAHHRIGINIQPFLNPLQKLMLSRMAA